MELERLPDDTLFIVFSFLNTRELTLLCRVSKKNWQVSELARSERTWKKLYEEFEESTYRVIYLSGPEKENFDEKKSSFGKYQVLRLAHYLHPRNIKVVLVGDGTVGKTCILIRYCCNKFTSKYLPTIFDNKVAKVRYHNKMVGINLWDTAGEEDYDTLRPLSYQDLETDVFVICFDVMSPTSFKNVKLKWYDEIIQYSENAKVIICGTKMDLRDDPESIRRLKERGISQVDNRDVEKVREELNAYAYIETSSKIRKNIDELFYLCLDSIHKLEGDDNTRIGYNNKKKKKKKKNGKGGCFVM